MIHKIKALYDNGNGLSKRQIALELGISRNSIKKYLSMEVIDISKQQEESNRVKSLDSYKEYIVHLLQSYPNLSAVKIMRRIKAKYTDITVSERTMRRYVESLKNTINCKQERYYQPVLDMVPGVQCQVDPGELRNVMIGGIEVTIYFVVFVLSYSRLMYVGLSSKPINTNILIGMHDAAFRYFGGCTEECVYDQTKMVVLHEEYRELVLNKRFHEYATYCGFNIRACEGYDPENKGKVEAGVKFVKHNGLYGEEFASWSDLESYKSHWLDTIANTRCHGTTGEAPNIRYKELEVMRMRPYNAPSIVQQDGQLVTRKADKTGLISWQSNKYSVPMAYQGGMVGVKPDKTELIVYDLITKNELARHNLNQETGKIIVNRNHYRDLNELTSDLENSVIALIGDVYGVILCALLKSTSPTIYKDQLRGVLQIFSSNKNNITEDMLVWLCYRPRLTATLVKDYILARISKINRCIDSVTKQPLDTEELSRYAQLTIAEAANVIH